MATTAKLKIINFEETSRFSIVLRLLSILPTLLRTIA